MPLAERPITIASSTGLAHPLRSQFKLSDLSVHGIQTVIAVL